jgi:hypothetical protein
MIAALAPAMTRRRVGKSGMIVLSADVGFDDYAPSERKRRQG